VPSMTVPPESRSSTLAMDFPIPRLGDPHRRCWYRGAMRVFFHAIAGRGTKSDRGAAVGLSGRVPDVGRTFDLWGVQT